VNDQKARLGIVLAAVRRASPRAEFVASRAKAEARGYHMAWTGEASGYDAISLMTTIAGHTSGPRGARRSCRSRRARAVVLGPDRGDPQPPGARPRRTRHRTLEPCHRRRLHGLTFGAGHQQIREAVR